MTEPTHKPDIFKSNQCPPLPVDASLLDRMVYWLGIGLGSGLPHTAPGTWGTLGGVLVGLPLLTLGFVPFLWITVLASVIGVWICGHTSELMGVHDDPHIVWDEWAGMWIAMLPIAYVVDDRFFVSSGFGVGHVIFTMMQSHSIMMTIVAFVLFRFFDILKPSPIKWADTKVSGGLGIMLDDILAGGMVIVLWLMVFLLQRSMF